MASQLLWLAWLVVSLLSVYLLQLLAHTRRRLPPGPIPLPLIGSLHLLGDQPHRSLAGLAKTYGPLMSLRLGAVTTVVVSSPAVAREFLQKHDAVFASRSVPDAAGEHAKNSVAWLPHASQWRALRRIMATELFAPQRLATLQGVRREKVAELVDHVRRLAGDGAAVDVGRVVFATGVNLLSRTIFSGDLTSLDDEGGSKEFQMVCAGIMETMGAFNVSDFFPALAAADLQGVRRRLGRMLAWLHRVLDAEVDRRLNGRSSGKARENDFLDVVLDGAPDKGGLDRDTFRTLFADLFAAGMANIATTMEWAMVELLQNPLSMAKVRDELEQVIGSVRNIEESEIARLPYLQAVMKETFRLHPPAPLLLPRQAETAIEITGYTIPKGARVLVNVWAMGQDKEIWSEPERFIPERFLESKIELRGADFELLPFGSGRRICPGMPLAMKMLHLILASLLNQFEWSLPIEAQTNGIDATEKFGVNLTRVVPLCAIATPI